jgi:hypothetical protein
MKIDYVPVYKFKNHHIILTETDIQDYEREDEYFMIDLEQNVLDTTAESSDMISLRLYFYEDHIEYESYGAGFELFLLSCDTEELNTFLAHLVKRNELKKEMLRLFDGFHYQLHPVETKLVEVEVKRALSLLEKETFLLQPTNDEMETIRKNRLEGLF